MNASEQHIADHLERILASYRQPRRVGVVGLGNGRFVAITRGDFTGLELEASLALRAQIAVPCSGVMAIWSALP